MSATACKELGEASENPFQYAGRENDGDTGLYYYRARYYSPEMARFISEDPIGLAGGINFYSYVGNRPVNFRDPLGLAPGDPFKSPDLAAIDAIDYSLPKSVNENREYGGFIYKISEDNYSYASPVPGNEGTIKPSTFEKPPQSAETVGIYHTHTGTGYGVPYFSTTDYFYGNFYKSIYLGTSTGLIKKWSPEADETIIRQPCDN